MNEDGRNEERTIWWWALGAFVLTAAGGAWWWWQVRTPSPLPVAQAPAAQPAPETPAGDAKIEHPIEAAPAAAAAGAAAPLPPLAESDSALRAAIGGLVGEQALLEFFQMTGIVARIVATVDSLPRSRVATKVLPVRGPGGAFAVEGGGSEERVIGAANADRYTAHLRLAEAVDAKRAAAVYLRFYPLLQQAYRELGYPQGHFNDRLVAVIDHLLATPQIDGPIRVVQPKVLYEFADPALEARSAGQKLLLRMGAENTARVKARLREFRRKITATPPPQ
jgi:hypothetical protein